ncbi:hypothetical protein PoMZ_12142 [Pyricularia oryzae]|uniref:Uncharacterized protein n=1 Tax=Pyricularia oryzae TaxID=318829 RepID=A0A4P7NM07_PYROR|nr:hypothetical protein PoMZ_12142 [Pyricularia oryzae]
MPHARREMCGRTSPTWILASSLLINVITEKQWGGQKATQTLSEEEIVLEERQWSFYCHQCLSGAPSSVYLGGTYLTTPYFPGSYGRRSLYREGETESGKIEQPASLLYEYLYMHKRVG